MSNIFIVSFLSLIRVRSSAATATHTHFQTYKLYPLPQAV